MGRLLLRARNSSFDITQGREYALRPFLKDAEPRKTSSTRLWRVCLVTGITRSAALCTSQLRRFFRGLADKGFVVKRPLSSTRMILNFLLRVGSLAWERRPLSITFSFADNLTPSLLSQGWFSICATTISPFCRCRSC